MRSTMGRKSAAEKIVALKSMLSEKKVIMAPGCYDALSAKLVEKAGFPAVYIGSYATCASQLGIPDVGLATMTEMVRHAEAVAGAVDIPVIADAEDGFNNAANIWRTVQEFEKAGVCAIHIEDGVAGKHTDIPPIILPLEQMTAKIRAAVDARQNPNFLIIGRTDVPWALRDIEETVRRVNAFTEAGADLVLPTAMPPQELKAVRSRIKGRVVSGLRRPGDSAQVLEEAGVSIIVWYPVCIRAAYHGVKTALARLQETTDIGKFGDILADADEFEDLFGYKHFIANVQKYGL